MGEFGNFLGSGSTGLLIWLTLVAGSIAAAIAESRRHRLNLGFLRGRGAEEKAGLLMAIYYGFPWVAITCAGLEFLFFGQKRAPLVVELVALLLIGSGFALRFWVIQTMGWLWTKKCMHRPGFPLMRKGPFALIPHPEYLSRAVEVLGFCLFLGTYATLGVSTAAIAVLATFVIRAETTQINSCQHKHHPSPSKICDIPMTGT
jgi:isoprenylcysteine carboxyl methyltransferase (ICMT) family protein YpbQ